MKKVFFCWLAVLGAGAVYAQDISAEQPVAVNNNIDSLLPRFCIDLNLKAGANDQSITLANLLSAYTNPLNVNISNPKYTGGSAYGFDVQGGYFFGKKRHWGIGTGLLYMSQSGSLTMDNYHIEYQATDFKGDVFRQVITANQSIKETITSTNMNIPLVLKYKHQLGRRLGFAADAGIVYNIQMQNNYTTNASFNYEAIYQRNADGGWVYDNSPTPDPAHDLLITQAELNKTDKIHGAGYDFANWRQQGYNVGLGIKPTSTSGNVSYKSGSIGLLLKPSLSYRVTRGFYLDLGLYYMSQTFKNDVNNYRLTDQVGTYNSMVKGETKVVQSNYGVSLGARFYFYKGHTHDRDGDGVADRKDKCPDVFGLKEFDGCPDTDKDGIPDKNDSCPTVFGLAQFNGCPDTDGDGIPDKDDRCPDKAGPAKFNGCPDTDGDGIPDIDDKCPKVAGLAMYAGCPDTDGDGVPDNEDDCPTVPGPKANRGCPLPKVEEAKPQEMEVKPFTETKQDLNRIDISTPILFDVNKFVIKPASKPILNEAAKEMKANKDAYIMIDAYTDATGTDVYNKALSVRRANAVKQYLSKLGVSGKRIKTAGHGKEDPLAPNETPEGREKNRRSIMKLDHKK